jgi:hypothetical protein
MPFDALMFCRAGQDFYGLETFSGVQGIQCDNFEFGGFPVFKGGSGMWAACRKCSRCSRDARRAPHKRGKIVLSTAA